MQHNREHASDVLQTFHIMIRRSGLYPHYVDPLTHLACYLAAIVHDYEHKVGVCFVPHNKPSMCFHIMRAAIPGRQDLDVLIFIASQSLGYMKASQRAA